MKSDLLTPNTVQPDAVDLLGISATTETVYNLMKFVIGRDETDIANSNDRECC